MKNDAEPKPGKNDPDQGSTRSGSPNESLKRDPGQFQEQLGIERMENGAPASNPGINAQAETLNQAKSGSNEQDKTGGDHGQVLNTEDQKEVINAEGNPDASINES